MEKQKLSKNKIIIISVICALLALMLVCCVTIAYFGQSRKFQGKLNFAPGIVIEYKNVLIENNNYSLCKLGNSTTFENFAGENDLTPLNESSNNVASEEIFYLANPNLKPGEGTIDYFLRVKLEYCTETEKGDVLLTPQQMLNVFGVENPLSINSPTESTAGFVKFGDYYYLVKANETTVNGYTNLYVNSNNVKADVQIFVADGIKNGVSYAKLELAKKVDYYLVQNFKVNLKVEAIDASENLFSSDIWDIVE